MQATILRNPGRGARPARTASPGDPRAFHRRLPGYAPTPLVDASALAAELGLGRLWVKDESSRLGLPAFKILGASWATYRLLVSRLGAEPAWSGLDDLRAALAPLGALTLVAATDGNHGRAVARVAALLGYRAHIFLPTGTAPARLGAIGSEGARVTVVDGTYEDAVARAAAEAAADVLVVADTAWEGYHDIPRWVIDGYATIFAEIDEQLAGARPDVVVCQMGVGALAAAVVEAWAGRAMVAVVEPRSAACGLRSAEAGRPVLVPGPHGSIMAGLNCGAVSPVAWPVVAAGTDVFVAIDDPAAERAMRDLAMAGVEAGETGAAGLAGLRALVDAGPALTGLALAGRSALVLCTEGATDPAAYRAVLGGTG